MMAEFGLYIHIPFCTALCHYCDFAKTARFGAAELNTYLNALRDEWFDWKTWCNDQWPNDWQIGSLYFGGGTPSLYSDALEPLLQELQPHLVEGAEVTFEVNPEHVDRERLRLWKQLGINRLSLGVQSFEADGLRFLTRNHTVKQARIAVDLSLELFSDVSLDLIYGWQGQSLEQWERELTIATQSGVSHLSLYVLTYAPGTPHGRRAQRGILIPTEDQELAARYEMARKLLARSGFVHEEVSNWAKPPYFAKHNRRYWLQQHYLALGLGAHGFLPINGELGWRFHHGQSLRAYTEGLTIQPVKLAEESRREVGEKSSLALLEKILSRWQVKGETRSPDDWLLEALGSGIRCQYGVSLREIQTKSGQVFKPTPFLTEQLAAGNTLYQENGRLLLDPSEWFRETAWCLEILKGFGPE